MRHPQHLDGIPGQLWRLVSLARHRLLMLDYDGTLAPFTTARQAAQPLPRSLALLRQIAAGKHTSVAIVSGRPLEELERLAGAIPAVFVGEHGWGRRGPDGRIIRAPLDHTVAATIERAARKARSSGWGDLVERKRAAVVLHTRSLPNQRARALEGQCVEAWQALSKNANVRVDLINGGVELRARGRNEGTVVLSLLSEAPPGTLGVFVGDDISDEDAFDVVRDWGFGVRVGDCEKASLAMGRIPHCEAVPAFLEEWLAVVRTAAKPAG